MKESVSVCLCLRVHRYMFGQLLVGTYGSIVGG